MTAQPRHMAPGAAACPCCGQALPDAVDAALAGALLTLMEWKVVGIVRRRPGLSGAALADVLYAGRADGGPIFGAHRVDVLVSRINRKLKPRGIEIRSRSGHTNAGYAIRPVGSA